MPRTDRLGITVSLVMVGLALSMLVSLPAREFAFVVLGSELTVRFSGSAQLALIMTALVCAGVDGIIRTHPLVYRRSLAYSFTFWVLPSLLTLAGLILLRDVPWAGYRVVLVGLTGAILAVVIVSQYRSIDPSDGRHRTARLTLNAVVYLSALILFVALYESRWRSLISATGVLMASSALALELLRVGESSTMRTWLYASLTGILLGELTWALNYYGMDARIGGTFLLLVFYTLTGLMQQYLWGRLNRHVVAEFGVVGIIGLLILTGSATWLLR
jgi:hypothetical protein